MTARASARRSRGGACRGGACTIARVAVLAVEVTDAADPGRVAYGVASTLDAAREAAHGRFVLAYGATDGAIVEERAYLDTPIGWVPYDPGGVQS